MQEADKIVTVSYFTKEKIVNNYCIPENKIEVVHNGIDFEDWDTTELTADLQGIKDRGDKIAAFVGRITIQKGPEYFLHAAKKVLEHINNVYFIFSGSGDMENQMIRLAVDLGISNKVLFAGFLRGDDLKALYKAADLYVMPSVSEPFGLIPVECMASGTPVIISKQTGVSEVLTHGLKVDFWDTDEMANKMISILGHESLAKALSENGREQAKQINWGKAAEKCIHIYDTLISSSRYKTS